MAFGTLPLKPATPGTMSGAAQVALEPLFKSYNGDVSKVPPAEIKKALDAAGIDPKEQGTIMTMIAEANKMATNPVPQAGNAGQGGFTGGGEQGGDEKRGFFGTIGDALKNFGGATADFFKKTFGSTTPGTNTGLTPEDRSNLDNSGIVPPEQLQDPPNAAIENAKATQPSPFTNGSFA